jgi:hypothetical protein
MARVARTLFTPDTACRRGARRRGCAVYPIEREGSAAPLVLEWDSADNLT